MGLFKLIEEERYEEFCKAYEKKLSMSKEEAKLLDSDLMFGNYVRALLGAKRYLDLVNVCENYIKEKKEERKKIKYENLSGFDFIGLFIGYLALNNCDLAKQSVKEAVNAPRQELGFVRTPLLMYYYGVALKDNNFKKESIKILKQRAKEKNPSISSEIARVKYVLDKITENELIEICMQQENESLRYRKMVSSFFYIAIKKYELNLLDEYKDYLIKAIDLYKEAKIVVLEIEYYLAKFELERQIHRVEAEK